MISGVEPYSSAIWLAADMREVLLKDAVMVTKLVTKTTRYFCIVGASYPGEWSSKSEIELAGDDEGVEIPFSESVKCESAMVITVLVNLYFSHGVHPGLEVIYVFLARP